MTPAYHNRTAWTFLFCFFCYLFAGSISLRCLQCSASGDQHCFDGISPAKECPNKKDKFCITFSGYVKETSEHRLFRNCTKTRLKDGCADFNISDHTIDGNEMKVCHFTCDTDGCNTHLHDLATNLGGFPPLILISTLLICASFLCY